MGAVDQRTTRDSQESRTAMALARRRTPGSAHRGREPMDVDERRATRRSARTICVVAYVDAGTPGRDPQAFRRIPGFVTAGAGSHEVHAAACQGAAAGKTRGAAAALARNDAGAAPARAAGHAA